VLRCKQRSQQRCSSAASTAGFTASCTLSLNGSSTGEFLDGAVLNSLPDPSGITDCPFIHYGIHVDGRDQILI
jgi:hypothetical protein